MLLKLILIPLLILCSLLASKRWGAFIGGILAGLPLISGPVSFFLTLEQGAVFSAQASYNTLLGVEACAVTALSYPWLAVLRVPWFLALPTSVVGFFVCGCLVQQLPHNILLASTLALCAPLTILYLLPRRVYTTYTGKSTDSHRVPWLIALQMAFGAALVCVVTAAAKWLGTEWSGILMFFPIMICVIAPFLHVTVGPAAVIMTMRGLMTGWFGGIAFTLVVIFTVERLSICACYSLAVAAALSVSFCLALLERKHSSLS